MSQADLWGREPPPPEQPQRPDIEPFRGPLSRLLSAASHLIDLVDEYEPERASRPAWEALRESVQEVQDLLAPPGSLVQNLDKRTDRYKVLKLFHDTKYGLTPDELTRLGGWKKGAKRTVIDFLKDSAALECGGMKRVDGQPHPAEVLKMTDATRAEWDERFGS